MKIFQFRLQRVLDYRDARVAEEERKVELLRGELANLNAALDRIEEEHHAWGVILARTTQFRGADLLARAAFQERLSREKKSLQQKRGDCEARLALQHKRYLEASRDYRLLEKLRDQQHEEWRLDTERQLEALASELYLARWPHEEESR